MTTELEQAGATGDDFFDMSDEDFLNASPPALDGQEPVVADQDEPVVVEAPVVQEPVAAEGDAAVVVEGDDKVIEGDTSTTNKPVAAEAAKEGGEPAAGAEAAPEGASPEGAGEAQQPNYEEFFKKVMTPFKANGKTFELKNPDEAIRLMQMGAGYGRKIQELQPHLKVLRMLEKNNLLDENKLSFLMDLNEKNPDAIKKIVKDSGLDPLDLNIDGPASYVPKNRSVSDNEINLHQALQDLQSAPAGQKTIEVINQTWDQEAKAFLWEHPETLTIIQDQRESGIYDQVVAEIDRQKVLGTIPPSTSFLKAYDIAGKHLAATNGFKLAEAPAQQIQNQPAIAPQTQVIATRAAAPKTVVQNGDKAAAAAGTKSSPAKAAITVNPLDMADDDFLKTFKGRF